MKTKILWLLVICLSFKLLNCSVPGLNLALLKPVYQSSSQKWIDTGHMAVDGRLETRWRARPNEPQWIYIDLLQELKLNKIIIHWDKEYAKDFSISISNDAKTWTELTSQKNFSGGTSTLAFPEVTARYVKLSCSKQALASGYAVKEFEIYGNNPQLSEKVSNVHKPICVTNGTTYLHSGWKLQNAAYLSVSGEQISQPNFDDSVWIPATVPSTVLGSYLDNKMLPDPDYADQQYMISEFFSTSNFWYRTEFEAKAEASQNFLWLNFAGINYEAEVFLNGKKLGTIKGAFIRGRFEISKLVRPEKLNALAVLIKPVPHPGEVSVQLLDSPGVNGGEITRDGPTFISSVGWDWMPTIRDRNSGIWQPVWIETSGAVTLADPFVITDLPLPQTNVAYLTVKVEVTNNSESIQNGKLRCKIEDIVIEKKLSLEPQQTHEISFKPTEFRELILKNPRLWWPVNYGKPELYSLEFSFLDEKGNLSHQLQTRFGIREIEAINKTPTDPLIFFVNGKKIFIRGGNWGIDNSRKRYDDERLRYLMRLHKEANLNMIRNWTGQTTQESFYALCDEFGFLVWDDFWLANNSDGPDPDDPNLFIQNAIDKIKRFRIHPSIALWCCRNESEPPPAIEAGIRQALEKYDSTRRFQRLSDEDGVTGNGPYSWQNPQLYFSSLAKGFSTEIGLPCIPSEESMRAMLPAEYLWKPNDMWGVHDYCNGNVKAFYYTTAVARQFGQSDSISSFTKKAQMVNMESYKALFEAWGANMWTKTTGVLLWMSNPAWPSLVFQIYDYYLEPTAAYFGTKKACEPLHILWDCSNDNIFVTNTTLLSYQGLKAQIKVFNLDGSLVFQSSYTLNIPANQAIKIANLSFPASVSKVHFLKLELTNEKGQLISDNFYWRSKEKGIYTDLNTLANVKLGIKCLKELNVDSLNLQVEIINPEKNVALMIRLKPVAAKTNERILPAFFSDNYFSLLPGEKKKVQIEMPLPIVIEKDIELVVEGWNIEKQIVRPE